jgi:two-component system, OmpR family, sensor histidine kinase QseC
LILSKAFTRPSLRSLRLRTTLLVVAAVAGLWCLAAVLTWRGAEHEANELFDGHLAQAAAMLIAQTAVEIEEPEELGDTHAPLTHRYARHVVFQVWEDGDRLLVHSEHAPSVRLSNDDEGFSDRRIEGVDWRVFSAWNGEHSLLVQVGERTEARRDMADELARGLLAPLLWALPLLAVLVWWAVARALRPLSALGEEIARRSPDRLDPMQLDSAPSEIEPVLERLNVLLARVDSALHAEKRFTGDAAHELRTPIAALSAQAQVALAEPDRTLQRKALAAVITAAGRLAHLVDQLLTLARADNTLPTDWPPVDFAQVGREAVAQSAPAAVARAVEIGLDAPDSLPWPGEPGWLGILLRNLIDNAVRHSPPQSIVRVALLQTDNGIEVLVEDRGPGVPDSQQDKLGERFWRGEEAAAGGSGLGLSIVRRIARLHAAQVRFENREGGGLRVRVVFTGPRWPAPSPLICGSAR